MASAQQLLQAFDILLQPERFTDDGPNGLQVEGRADVRRLVSGVTASHAQRLAVLLRHAAVVTHVVGQLGIEHRFIGIDNPA